MYFSRDFSPLVWFLECIHRSWELCAASPTVDTCLWFRPRSPTSFCPPAHATLSWHASEPRYFQILDGGFRQDTEDDKIRGALTSSEHATWSSKILAKIVSPNTCSAIRSTRSRSTSDSPSPHPIICPIPSPHQKDDPGL